MNELNIAFVGGGNMAEAMIAGLLRSGHPAEHIGVGEPSAGRRKALAERHGVRVSGDNGAVVSGADLVVLAVKPQQMQQALTGLSSSLMPEATVLSIAAGVRTDSLRAWLGGHDAIVRAMPNTPALVGAGIAAVFTEAGEPHRAHAIYARSSKVLCLQTWIKVALFMRLLSTSCPRCTVPIICIPYARP
ncbi:MAG: NAD(P)-binding domain-containing protein [Mariprofundaceae bacterium]